MATIKLTHDGKVITRDGKPSCNRCCPALPSPQELSVNDLSDPTALSYSGNVQSNEFPKSYLCCFVPKCKILTGSVIDDYGTIGGVLFDNHVPFQPGRKRTIVLSDTDVAVTTVAATATTSKIKVEWSAVSPVNGPTGLGAVLANGTVQYCIFRFYWEDKPSRHTP